MRDLLTPALMVTALLCLVTLAVLEAVGSR